MFNVSSTGKNTQGVEIPGICQETRSYDALTHACADNDVVLTVNLCPYKSDRPPIDEA